MLVRLFVYLIKLGKMGKNKYIETPDRLLELWNEYKAQVGYDIIQVATGKGVHDTRVKKPILRQGFEAYCYNKLGHHVYQYIDNVDNRYEDYLGVVTHMRKEWEQDQISGSLTGRYKSPNLVARLNGLTDKKEVTNKGKLKFKFGE